MLGIQENNLNFEVLPIKDPKYLVIFDLSDYMELPKQPNLRVTLPGYHKPVFLPFKKDSINKYNSNSLQPRENTLELFDLPDGIYKISYHIYPQDEAYVEKYHLQTSIFDRQHSQFLLSLEASDCSLKHDREIKVSIIEAELFIDTAKAHVEEGNLKTAEEFYRKANDLLSKLNRKLKSCY
jgi:hypothetical protein